MKAIPLIVACLGCYPAFEHHGGAAPIPAKVTDAEFAAIGATFDQGLILAKVPVVPRIAVDALAAWSIRNVSTFGRTADSGFLFVIGVYPPEFVRFVTHAGKHNREHPCPSCWPASYWARRDSLERARQSRQP